jgi:hypothetical protein
MNREKNRRVSKTEGYTRKFIIGDLLVRPINIQVFVLSTRPIGQINNKDRIFSETPLL